MRKKVIMIILTIAIILLLMGGISLLISSNNKNGKLVNEIINKKDNKETELVFVTSSDSDCYLCSDAKDIVDTIAKKYNLSFTSFDKSKSSSDYKELQKKLAITDKEIKEPAVIIIKDGELKSIANEIYNSSILRSMLIEQGIINDETKDDKEITMIETMEKFQGTENSLLVLLDSSTNSVAAREVINNLASKYNFTFSLAYFDRSDDGMSIATFLNQMNGDDLLVVPYFAVVSNNKIQEAISTTSSKELEVFLKRNKIINVK